MRFIFIFIIFRSIDTEGYEKAFLALTLCWSEHAWSRDQFKIASSRPDSKQIQKSKHNIRQYC